MNILDIKRCLQSQTQCSAADCTVLDTMQCGWLYCTGYNAVRLIVLYWTQCSAADCTVLDTMQCGWLYCTGHKAVWLIVLYWTQGSVADCTVLDTMQCGWLYCTGEGSQYCSVWYLIPMVGGSKVAGWWHENTQRQSWCVLTWSPWQPFNDVSGEFIVTLIMLHRYIYTYHKIR